MTPFDRIEILSFRIQVAEVRSVLRSIFARPAGNLRVCTEPRTTQRFCMLNNALDYPDPRPVADNVRVH